MRTIVIIGASHAGVQAADSLRAGGYTGAITLIGAEERFPYQRPPLSKDFMLGAQSDFLPLRGPKFFEDNTIDLLLGERADKIDRRQHSVTLGGGESLHYDGLILATGSTNRRLAIGSDEPGDGMFDLRTADDALRLREKLAHVQRAVVIGAGFVGLEFAAAATHQGVGVTVIEFADRPMARVLSPAMSDVFSGLHVASGVDLRMNEGATAVTWDGFGKYTVCTTGGARIETDMILCSVGAEPNSELAAAAGLEVDNGIVVNGQLRTSDPCIWAIGDCARYPSRFSGGLTRLESVQNAVDHARHVAKVILGERADYDEVPWFWTIQGKHKLQIAGIYKRGDVSVVRERSSGKYSVFSFRDGKLSSVESLNDPADHVAARKILGTKNDLDIDLVKGNQFDLKEYWKSGMDAR